MENQNTNSNETSIVSDFAKGPGLALAVAIDRRLDDVTLNTSTNQGSIESEKATQEHDPGKSQPWPKLKLGLGLGLGFGSLGLVVIVVILILVLKRR